MNKKIKVEEIIAHLNELVGDLKGVRVGPDDSSSGMIRDRVADYLKSLGLEIGTWGAKLIWEEGSFFWFHSDLFRYTLPNWKRDGRYKWNRAGTMVDAPVWAARYENGIRDHKNPLVVEADPGSTLYQYLLKIERAERQEKVESSQASIEALQEQLKDAYKRRQVADSELFLIDEMIKTESNEGGQV